MKIPKFHLFRLFQPGLCHRNISNSRYSGYSANSNYSGTLVLRIKNWKFLNSTYSDYSSQVSATEIFEIPDIPEIPIIPVLLFWDKKLKIPKFHLFRLFQPGLSQKYLKFQIFRIFHKFQLFRQSCFGIKNWKFQNSTYSSYSIQVSAT